MTSSFIQPLISLALVFLASLARRDREVDSAGNPSVRFWSACFLGVTGGCFFLWVTLKNLGDPFHQRYPENTAVEAFFCVFGFLLFAWGFCYKITLTATAITVRYLPFVTRVYPIAGVDAVKSISKRGAVIRFRDGRKIPVMALFSGTPFFLENLGTLLSRRA
jgi:hypothetical protein